MSRRCLARVMPLVLCGLALGAAAAPAGAQSIETVTRGPRFLAAWTSPAAPVDVNSVGALRRRVTLDLNGASVDEALKELTRQAGLDVSYTHELLPKGRRLSLQAQDITVAAALTEVLLDTGLDVAVGRNGRLALVPAPKRVRVEAGSVVGRVTNAKTGDPLAGAEVLLEGTALRTATREDGGYRLTEVPPGSYTLAVRRIGYSPARRPVTVADGQESTVDVALEPRATQLDEVVVTGTVVPTEVKALPTPVSVIDLRDFEGRYVQNIGEIFRQVVPGAASPVLVSTPRQTPLSLRGASRLQSGAGMVKVYVDGIEVSNFNSAGIDPASIERVEVIRGPQAAAIYGSDAMGGVMQVFTKRGDPTRTTPKFELEAALGRVESPYETGSALTQQYRASMSGGTGDASYRIGGGYKHVGEWMPHYFQSEPTAHAALSLGRGPLTVELTGRYELTKHRTDDVGNPELRETGYPYFENVQFTDTRTKWTAQTFAATVRYSPTSWWRHELVAGRDRDETSTRSGFPARAYPGDDYLMVSTSNDSKTSINYSTSLVGDLGAALSGSLTAGVAHYFLSREFWATTGAMNTEGNIQLAPGAYVASLMHNVRNTGYFAQGQLGLHESLFLTAGVRWEHNTSFGAELSPPLTPRVGLSWVRDVGGATVKARAAYGEAIRPPSVGMRDTVVTQQQIQYGNPDLAPERQTGWDAGIDVHFGTRASIGVTHYRQTARDLIQQVVLEPTAGVYTFTYQNLARVRNTGWEFEGRLELGALRLTGQYALTRSRVGELGDWYTGSLEPGEQIHGLPASTGGLSADLTLGTGTMITGGVTYVGSQRGIDYVAYYRCEGGTGPCRPTINDYYEDFPGFAKVNVALTQPVRRGLVGFVRVENLTGVSPGEFSNFYADPGRTMIAGFRFEP